MRSTLASRPVLLAIVAAGCVCLLGCSRCGASGGIDAGQLTEADTEAIDGGVTGDEGRWALQVPGGWHLVKAEQTRRLMPGIERWLVNPVLDAYLTVRCSEVAPGKTDTAQLQAKAQARATAMGRTFNAQSSARIEGPWLDGVKLTYQTQAGSAAWQHIHLGVAQLKRECEVQAWTRAGTPASLRDLELITNSFTVTPTPSDRAVAGLFQVLREPAVQARANELADAGIRREQLGLALAGSGLPRLPDEFIDERFRLRLALLERSPQGLCGSLVRQFNDRELSLATLDQLTLPEAERWAAIGRAAILAEVNQIPVPVRDEKAVETAKQALLARDEQLTGALQSLESVNANSDASLCAAERLRLTRAFELPLATRVTLFRRWLSR